MKTDDLIAIDVHTHAEVSCWNPFDNCGEEVDRPADQYFGANLRPTIEETIAHYRAPAAAGWACAATSCGYFCP